MARDQQAADRARPTEEIAHAQALVLGVLVVVDVHGGDDHQGQMQRAGGGRSPARGPQPRPRPSSPASDTRTGENLGGGGRPQASRP